MESTARPCSRPWSVSPGPGAGALASGGARAIRSALKEKPQVRPAGSGKSGSETEETKAGEHARGQAVGLAHRRNNDVSFQSSAGWGGLNVLITGNVHIRRHSSPQNKDAYAGRPGEPEVGLPLFCSSIRAGS